jgi:hypothetical protein
MNIVVIILIILLLCGGIGTLPTWGVHNWGYYPSGGIGLILLILIILLVTGRL